MSIITPTKNISRVPLLPTCEKKDNENKVLNFTKKYFSCPTVWLTLLAIGITIFTPLAFHFLLPTAEIFIIDGVALASMATIAAIYKKQLLFETDLYSSLIYNKFVPQKWSWYTPLDNNIILGAMPLKTNGHLEELINFAKGKEKLAILTLAEPWEIEKETPFSSYVKPKDWERNKVKQLIIETKDHVPLSLEKIEEAVRFIQTQVKQGKKVYVHCKGGRGRSATALVCYYMIKNGWTPKQAMEFIKEKRSVTLYKKSKQVRIKEFYEQIYPTMRREQLPWYRRIFS